MTVLRNVQVLGITTVYTEADPGRRVAELLFALPAETTVATTPGPSVRGSLEGGIAPLIKSRSELQT